MLSEQHICSKELFCQLTVKKDSEINAMAPQNFGMVKDFKETLIFFTVSWRMWVCLGE